MELPRCPSTPARSFGGVTWLPQSGPLFPQRKAPCRPYVCLRACERADVVSLKSASARTLTCGQMTGQADSSRRRVLHGVGHEGDASPSETALHTPGTASVRQPDGSTGWGGCGEIEAPTLLLRDQFF